ncbi:MAG TPA: type II toxin-antitoxin system VapC family toxin [Candidatus Nanoarchaeia archaeon]|nr:type II toxin-antitoxin system VapC family toxin [Candidatus Nanoarchaeia archaeon]
MQLRVERINRYLLDKAIILARSHNLTLYDAIYAALAQVHGCPLVTEDKQLLAVPNAMALADC